MALKTTLEQRSKAAGLGVSMSTIRARMHDGLSFEDALECILRRRDAAMCDIHGVRYPSLNAAAVDHGLNPSAVFSIARYHPDLTKEEVIDLAVWRKHERSRQES